MGNKRDPRVFQGGAKRASSSAFSVREVYEKNQMIFNVVAVLIAVLFSLVIYQQSSSSIQNLSDASDDALKGVFTGSKPYIFYCARGTGKDEKVAPIFAELNKVKGNKYGWAMVNCNHKLPSGKTVMDRFSLNRKTKPIIFMTAPWFGGRAKQATGASLKDTKTLSKFVDSSLAPRAQEVTSDRDLAKYCGWGKSSITHDDKSIGTSCVVFVKGKRHAKAHADIEERLIREHPRQRYISLDANKKRLNFEDTESLPADSFAIKVHALRNGTHHMSMVNPVTWDYLSTFVSHAVGTPLYDFDGDGAVPVKLKKVVPPTAFRDRSRPKETPPPPRDETEDQDYEGDGMSKEQRKARRDRLKKERGGSSRAADEEEKPEELTPEEIEQHRLEKEAKAREYLEKLRQEQMFEEVDEYDGTEEGQDEEEEEEEDLIEL